MYIRDSVLLLVSLLAMVGFTLGGIGERRNDAFVWWLGMGLLVPAALLIVVNVLDAIYRKFPAVREGERRRLTEELEHSKRRWDYFQHAIADLKTGKKVHCDLCGGELRLTEHVDNTGECVAYSVRCENGCQSARVCTQDVPPSTERQSGQVPRSQRSE